MFRLKFVILSMAGLLLIGESQAIGMPDFTKGDPIPQNALHDWNLGATGLRGWIYSDKMVSSDARQIRVTQVAPGSPADGVLQVGDVISGVSGKPFSYDPRIEFAKVHAEILLM